MDSWGVPDRRRRDGGRRLHRLRRGCRDALRAGLAQFRIDRPGRCGLRGCPGRDGPGIRVPHRPATRAGGRVVRRHAAGGRVLVVLVRPAWRSLGVQPGRRGRIAAGPGSVEGWAFTTSGNATPPSVAPPPLVGCDAATDPGTNPTADLRPVDAGTGSGVDAGRGRGISPGERDRESHGGANRRGVEWITRRKQCRTVADRDGRVRPPGRHAPEGGRRAPEHGAGGHDGRHRPGARGRRRGRRAAAPVAGGAGWLSAAGPRTSRARCIPARGGSGRSASPSSPSRTTNPLLLGPAHRRGGARCRRPARGCAVGAGLRPLSAPRPPDRRPARGVRGSSSAGSSGRRSSSRCPSCRCPSGRPGSASAVAVSAEGILAAAYDGLRLAALAHLLRRRQQPRQPEAAAQGSFPNALHEIGVGSHRRR